MITFLLYLFILIQLLLGIHFWLPAICWLRNLFSSKKTQITNVMHGNGFPDFAVIITAYGETEQIPAVVRSVLRQTYGHFLVYVVADNCDVSGLSFNDERVMLLRPANVLASNIRSHFHAIDRFVRNHDVITIIDSDNIVHPDYLKEMSFYFRSGYQAVQGVRKAKNLNTVYACLDEAGDMYYRYIDRYLLYRSGSSASLAGSGMAFSRPLYRSCLQKETATGAGFDKILQYRIVAAGLRIAFAEKAIVLDEKTAKTEQLVRQRARWLNTWFRFWGFGIKLLIVGVRTFSFNRFAFALMLLRPPLFILLAAAIVAIAINLLMQSVFSLFWLVSLCVFVIIFFSSLRHFKAGSAIYRAVYASPLFVWHQLLALMNVKRANEISVATKHDHDGVEFNFNDHFKKNRSS
jgi:cellulose synthase/poly-beta-1,6-N-acetylglucosamine synthase-like glycosyltransferase